MQLNCEFGTIEIVNEPTYTFDSADNIHAYALEMDLSEESRASSIHGILLNNKPMAIFGASGGCSTVHANSAIVVGSHLYLAVGDHVVRVVLPSFQFEWAVKSDTATCFGIYFDTPHFALLSHGELEISRISEHGHLLWSSSGADIFTEGFELFPKYIQATDFNGRIYRFDYDSGAKLY